MSFKNITVAGSGVLGSQIAYQTAFKGFSVSVYDLNDEALEKAKERVTKLKERYKEDLDASDQEVNDAFARTQQADLASSSLCISPTRFGKAIQQKSCATKEQKKVFLMLSLNSLNKLAWFHYPFTKNNQAIF
ncbi:3-hydroxybutyryl-CoA dehydrogenase [Bacillus sp. JCM 19046]|nr:3-hydroxybutyryl-CoA dehydrogenase [Bacillus sp. JCM 19045]GAF16931.1 3-hydroxybutyryl-CoA dehydrogenase [Bacillus sp. JCM 19046]